MKFTLALLAMFSAKVFAAPASTDICTRFMTCGTFVADEVGKDGKKFQTKIIVKSTGPMEATFDYVFVATDGIENVWPLTAKFNDDGSVIMRYKDQFTYAVAMCKHNMCNYALIPFEDEGKIWGNAGLMRFTADSLEFLMVAGSPVNYRDSSTVLKKR